MTEGPCVLATKAANQYRKRDIFGYLGLRHLFSSSVARLDRWAREVAVEQILNRKEGSYFFFDHFKEIDAHGKKYVRQIAIPGPIEIMAETALLTECAKHSVFRSASSVCTYELAKPSDRQGVFVDYMAGLRKRHAGIAAACESNLSSVVKYLDIKKFYPSIRLEHAASAWMEVATVLPEDLQALGNRLLKDHSSASAGESRSILTGPMFSHLCANLVMRKVDAAASKLEVDYFRYVDDITLVGDVHQVRSAERKISEMLKDLDLELHAEGAKKSIEVSASDWLQGKGDFDSEVDDVSWASLIGDVKTLLTLKPDASGDLERALRDEGARLPFYDYSEAIRESRHADSFFARAQRDWFRRQARKVSTERIRDKALSLRARLEKECLGLASEISSSHGYARKRAVPKLRFRMGKLIYLANEESLARVTHAVSGISELTFQKIIAKAALSGDVSEVFDLGVDAAQASAQTLRASNKSVQLEVNEPSESALQGLAALSLNGIHTNAGGNLKSSSNELYRLCEGNQMRESMQSKHPFVREVACLVGSQPFDHSVLLSTAFDRDENVVFDAVEMVQQSMPFDA